MAEHPLKVVLRQANDQGTWFVAEHASEAYLQAQLRELHKAVEDYFSTESFSEVQATGKTGDEIPT